jgi:hypothetical protein
MPMTCPRCQTDVPYEARYCPYCSLPKPKDGSLAWAQPAPEDSAPGDEPKPETPSKAVGTTRTTNQKVTGVRSKRRAKPSRKLRFGFLSVGALVVALAGVGIYTFVLPIARSQEAEPKTVLSALETLRHMPSNEQGQTIDARLSRELETSRRVGNLVAYQGWTTNRIKGTKTKVLLVYSFREVGNTDRRAEWLADLVSMTFTPQTDLAVSVSKK